MCKIESYKAFEEAERVYENFLRENFDMNGLNEESIKKIHSEAKVNSMGLFKRKSMGDIATDYEHQLKSKMKEKLSFYTKLNQEETKNNLLKLLQKWYPIIEFKIQSTELKTVDDIEYELKSVEYKVNEAFNSFELKDAMLNDFKSRILSFAAEFFLNKMHNEIELVKAENTQIMNNLSAEANETKANFEKEITKKNAAIDQKKLETSELKEELSKIKEKLAISEKENDLNIKNYNDKLSNLKEESERKLTEIQSKLSLNDEKTKDAERRALTVQAESEKDKALTDQKIDHLSKQLEDYAKKEKESGSELKSQLKEQAIALKDSQTKYEAQLKTLSITNEQLREKIIDLEGNLNYRDESSESEKNKIEEQLMKLNLEKEDLNSKLLAMKTKLDSEK